MWTRAVGAVLGAIVIAIVTLSASEARDARIAAAADAAEALYREWLGPPPAGLRVETRGMPACSTPRSMDIESMVAYELAMQWWRWRDGDQSSGEFFSALSWYLQGRAVERLHDRLHAAPGHSAVTMRAFGGHLPWTIPLLTVDRLTAAALMPPSAARGALAFATAERYAGWPSFQGALHVLAERAAQGPLGRDEAIGILTDAAGQDLSWLSEILDTNRVDDVAIDDVTTSEGRTRVTVGRTGAPFTAGGGVEVRVTFEDGQQASARWDGASQSHVIEFHAARAPAIVEIDPQRILLVDANPLNNRVAVAARPISIGKWAASWAVWLQDAALTASVLF